MKRLSDQIRLAILDSGLSRYQIAQATGIDESSLAKFCKGIRGLSMPALDALGLYLQLTITAGHHKRKGKESSGKHSE
jgi:transcriptional regulator with XRE-family HTH domain